MFEIKLILWFKKQQLSFELFLESIFEDIDSKNNFLESISSKRNKRPDLPASKFGRLVIYLVEIDLPTVELNIPVNIKEN